MNGNELVILDQDLITQPDLTAWGLRSDNTIRYRSTSAPPDLGVRQRVYYVLSLSSGGLSYQTALLEKNPHVSQWVLLAGQREDAPLWAFEKQLERLTASIHLVRTQGKSAEEVRKEIASVVQLRRHSCLIYSRRGGVGKRAVVELLREKLHTDWEFELAEGAEEEFRQRCGGMERVLIMGRALQDFSISKPEQIELPPVFLYHPCDEDVQHCLQPDALWSGVREVLSEREWKFPASYPDFFVGSALYENWAVDIEANGGTQSLALSEQFVMWDRFGLPVPREQYTEKAIREFLSGFQSIRNIQKLLAGSN